MQLEPAFGLKFSKYLLELLRDNVTGFHCVGVPRHGEEKCVQSSPSSFHIRGQPPWRLHQCGPSPDLLASLAWEGHQNIPLQSQKNRPRLRKLASSKPLSAERDCEEREATADALAKCPKQAICSPQGCTAKQRRDKDSYI